MNASDHKKLIFIPKPYQDILPDLVAGRGDIAAAGFTITDERLKKVDFTKPYLPDVDEIVVRHREEQEINSIEDLAGREVYVLADSSWEEHLQSLNNRLIAKGLQPIDIVKSDPEIETVDILELVNSGSVPLTVVDDYVGELWSRVFPNIALQKVHRIQFGPVTFFQFVQIRIYYDYNRTMI